LWRVFQSFIQWKNNFYIFLECVFVFWNFQYRMSIHQNFTYDLRSYTISFHAISKRIWLPKNAFKLKMCVFICSTTFVRNIFYSRKNWVLLRSSCPIKMKLEFCWLLLTNTEKQYFTKIRKIGAEVLHADRRIDRNTDMKKPIIPFRNFPETPNKSFLFNQNRVLPHV
jgi:hypothetical protein